MILFFTLLKEMFNFCVLFCNYGNCSDGHILYKLFSFLRFILKNRDLANCYTIQGSYIELQLQMFSVDFDVDRTNSRITIGETF